MIIRLAIQKRVLLDYGEELGHGFYIMGKVDGHGWKVWKPGEYKSRKAAVMDMRQGHRELNASELSRVMPHGFECKLEPDLPDYRLDLNPKGLV